MPNFTPGYYYLLLSFINIVKLFIISPEDQDYRLSTHSKGLSSGIQLKAKKKVQEVNEEKIN